MSTNYWAPTFTLTSGCQTERLSGRPFRHSFVDHWSIGMLEWVVRGSEVTREHSRQWRQRPRQQRLAKNDFIFYHRISRFYISLQNIFWSQNLLKLNNYGIPALNSKQIHEKLAAVVSVLQNTQNLAISRCCFLQRTAKKCTRIYNAPAQLFFLSFNLLFGDVLTAVAVVVCFKFSQENNFPPSRE